MSRGRPKKVTEEKVLALKLSPPCSLVFEAETFDPSVLDGYSWTDRGIYYTSDKKMLCVEVEGRL